MTLEELKEQCLKAKANGIDKVMLVVPRNQPPSRENIRVKGLGIGYVCNAGEREDGTWSVVAQFDADYILTTIEKQERIDSQRSSQEQQPPCAPNTGR